jgi:hypothetical protein
MNGQMRCIYCTGGVERKNSEGYPDPTAYQALINIFKPLVYICSPYAGAVERNTESAKLYCRFAVMERNVIAFAPHLLLPLYLSEDDPEERELALSMGLTFLTRCDELWVFGENITRGMQKEITKAKKYQMPIHYFTEAMEEVHNCV